LERKDKQKGQNVSDLKAPSLIRENCADIKKTDISTTTTKDQHHHKHVENKELARNENKRKGSPETRPFLRSPGRWSFKGINPISNQNTNKEDKSEKLNDDKKCEAKPQNIKSVFQRSWSLRGQNKTAEQDILSGQRNGITRKDKYLLPLKKSSSQNNLPAEQQGRNSSEPGKMAPAVAIPSEVSDKKLPCVGILKTPGKRKTSSNNRVEFLNNVREREIPGRQA